MPHKAAHSNLAEQQQHSGMQASPLQPPAAQQTAVAGALVGTTSFTTTQPANAVSAQQQQQQQQQQRQRPDPRSLFHKGVAISVWQNSSDEASNWTAFMRRKRFFGQGQLLQAFMESNDFWNRCEEDMQLVTQLGCNSFRFSFEWARIEPAPGQIDASAIQRYHAMLDSMEAAGLLPNATLHHFTHPQWFEERGGWTNPDNIPAFLSYCSLVFREFGPRIAHWATFNEPSCFALCGYIMGLWAPGKRGRLIQAGQVLGNMLKAHVAAYRALKVMPHGDTAQIGIVHQHIRFIPHCNHLAALIVKAVCRWMTYWFATRQMISFFQTGKFSWSAPLLGCVISFEEPGAVGALDWWGINYYSRPAISSTFKLVGTGPSEPLTGMGMPLVAADLHSHLMQAHRELKVPIFVSETGVSDSSHELRARCISSYYNEVLRAIADGADVRGTYYWTLMDNIEWHHGFNQHFGLYEWRPPGSNSGPGRPTDGSSLQLREGSKALVALHAAWPEQWREVAAFAQQSFAGTGPAASAQANPAGASGAGGEDSSGDGDGAAALKVPGVPEQEQQQLLQEVGAADKAQAGQQGRREVEEPLLGGGGRISDAV